MLCVIFYCELFIDRLPRLGKRELFFLISLTWQLCGFCKAGFPLPVGAWDWLRYFIVSLHGPSI